jgi:molybdate transport system substrate-binding protein
MPRLALILTGLLALGGVARAEEATRLTVSIAASVKDVVSGPIVTAFTAAHPGVEISVNSGPSGMLARQIEDGAPVDVLVSAGWPEIQRLQAKSLVAGPPVVVARNRLVMIVPDGSRWLGRTPRAVLEAPDVRIASGDPATVPFGAYAKQALAAIGLWDAVQPRLVFAADVRQALTYADQGAVDAAIVYATDARVAKSAKLLGEVPGAETLRIELVAVRLARAQGPAAEAFLAALRSPTARAALDAAGFLPPP